MFLYEVNETMRMLSKQYIYEILLGNKSAHKDFKNLIKAYEQCNRNTTTDLAYDAFMLGYIYGKRAEREKKHGIQ